MTLSKNNKHWHRYIWSQTSWDFTATSEFIVFEETLHYYHYCQHEVIVIWIKSLSNTLVSVSIHLLQTEQINFWLRRNICSSFQLFDCTAESATSSRTIPHRLLTTGNSKWSDSSFKSGCMSVSYHTSLRQALYPSATKCSARFWDNWVGLQILNLFFKQNSKRTNRDTRN